MTFNPYEENKANQPQKAIRKPDEIEPGCPIRPPSGADLVALRREVKDMIAGQRRFMDSQ